MTPEQKIWFDHIQESRHLNITMKEYCASHRLRYGEMIRRKKLLEPYLTEYPTGFVELKKEIPLPQTIKLKLYGSNGRSFEIEGSCTSMAQLIESMI